MHIENATQGEESTAPSF